MYFDIIIRNGSIIDGTGRDSYKADIAILGDKIVDIGVIKGASKKEINDPNAMTLSTIFNNQPSSRVVLLKFHDEQGFVFYTNSNSKKGKSISENNFVIDNEVVKKSLSKISYDKIYLTSAISKFFSPDGVTTVISSFFFFPIKALPIGDLK